MPATLPQGNNNVSQMPGCACCWKSYICYLIL